MNKTIYITAAIALLVIGFFVVSNKKDATVNEQIQQEVSAQQNIEENATESANEADKNASVGNEDEAQYISLDEIAKHNKEDDCWVGYEGKVYDVTKWLEKHPGGKDKILTFCGTVNEFSEKFKNKHKDSTMEKLSNASEKGYIQTVGEYMTNN